MVWSQGRAEVFTNETTSWYFSSLQNDVVTWQKFPSKQVYWLDLFLILSWFWWVMTTCQNKQNKSTFLRSLRVHSSALTSPARLLWSVYSSVLDQFYQLTLPSFTHSIFVVGNMIDNTGQTRRHMTWLLIIIPFYPSNATYVNDIYDLLLNLINYKLQLYVSTSENKTVPIGSEKEKERGNL